MKYEYLKEYFYRYVEQYYPYKDNAVYRVLISFLEDEYFKDAYENIPEGFKILFEEHSIQPFLFDTILQSIGYPKSLLSEIPTYHKQIILNKFSDYSRNKGTLQQFKSIVTEFQESVSISELYIDFRKKQNVFDWWFFPKLIQSNFTIDYVKMELDYQTVYDGTPTYFVSKQQLHNLYVSNNITLPLKSNLILFNMANVQGTNDISSIIATTVAAHIKNYSIILTFNDGIFKTTFGEIYQLWHYIFAFYNKEVCHTPPSGADSLCFNVNTDMNPYIVEDGFSNSLSTLIEEYEALSTPDAIWEFYKTKILEPYSKTLPIQTDNLDSFTVILSYSINTLLYEYIRDKLTNPQTVLNIFEITNILQQIQIVVYNFLKESEDSTIIKYKEWLITIFDLSILTAEKTTTYKLLNYFKPYHCQFIFQETNLIQSKSKFDTATPLDKHHVYVTREFPSTVYTISDDAYFCEEIEYNYEVNTVDFIITDYIGAHKFKIGDYFYTREIRYNPKYPVKIISISDIIGQNEYDSGVWEIPENRQWKIQFEKIYEGPFGLFSTVYKKYHMLMNQGD